MLFLGLGINKNIVDEDYHELVEVFHEDLVHQVGCPVQNMRATKVAAAELPYLHGEELHQQTRRVQQLINTANRQQRETEEIGRASCRERVYVLV